MGFWNSEQSQYVFISVIDKKLQSVRQAAHASHHHPPSHLTKCTVALCVQFSCR